VEEEKRRHWEPYIHNWERFLEKEGNSSKKGKLIEGFPLRLLKPRKKKRGGKRERTNKKGERKRYRPTRVV